MSETTNKIFLKILNIVKTFASKRDALDQISFETNIFKDLGVNSARYIDIILKLEDEFKINVQDISAAEVRNMKDLLLLVEKHSRKTENTSVPN